MRSNGGGVAGPDPAAESKNRRIGDSLVTVTWLSPLLPQPRPFLHSMTLTPSLAHSLSTSTPCSAHC